MFFSILFSTLPDKISGALTSAAQTDPAFQAAMADPAVRANPVNAPFFALAQGGGDVLNDSAFLQTIDARLAQPILVGFSNSITLVFLVAACVIAVGFVLVLFVRELPLRTMSGARAAAMEEAARTGEVPTTVAAEAVPTDAVSGGAVSGGAVSGDAVSGDAVSGDAVSGDAVSGDAAGRHVLTNGAAARAGSISWSDGPVWSDGAALRPIGATPDADGGGPSVEGDPRRPVGAVPRPDGGIRRAVGANLDPDSTQPVGAAPWPDGATHGPDAASPAAAEPVLDGRSADAAPSVVGTATRPDGKGLPTVVVTVADATGRQEARTTTDGDGRYAVALRDPGTYLVVAAAGAYQPHAALVVVRPGGATRHDVTLSGTSGVHGVVRHGEDAVAGAAVTLIDAQGDVAAVGVTDGSGHYRLVGVPDGAYTLTASSAGHQPGAVSLWLDVGITVERNVDLPQRSRLVGTVTAVSTGRPVEAAATTLVDAGGVVVATTVTDADGAFSFADLAAGTYTLTARGYAPTAQTVHVTAGAPASAEILLGKAARAAVEPGAARPVH